MRRFKYSMDELTRYWTVDWFPLAIVCGVGAVLAIGFGCWMIWG